MIKKCNIDESGLEKRGRIKKGICTWEAKEMERKIYGKATRAKLPRGQKAEEERDRSKSLGKRWMELQYKRWVPWLSASAIYSSGTVEINLYIYSYQHVWLTPIQIWLSLSNYDRWKERQDVWRSLRPWECEFWSPSQRPANCPCHLVIIHTIHWKYFSPQFIFIIFSKKF